MMSFKRSFGLTRSLFILYVYEHNLLGFGMLTVETSVIAFVDFNSSNCDRKRSVVSSPLLFGIGCLVHLTKAMSRWFVYFFHPNISKVYKMTTFSFNSVLVKTVSTPNKYFPAVPAQDQFCLMVCTSWLYRVKAVFIYFLDLLLA